MKNYQIYVIVSALWGIAGVEALSILFAIGALAEIVFVKANKSKRSK
jgi:hypothetical protein